MPNWLKADKRTPEEIEQSLTKFRSEDLVKSGKPKESEQTASDIRVEGKTG